MPRTCTRSLLPLILIACLGAPARAGVCPDVDRSGTVDVDDLVAVILDWGSDGCGYNGDVDGSGTVDVDDMVAVITGWGPAPAKACDGVPREVLSIDVWYGDQRVFGAPGKPQNQVNIIGNVAAANGLSELTWSLNCGAPQPLSFGPNLRRLEDPGDFNVEIFYDDLPVGTNSVTIHAVDELGNEVKRHVVVEHVDRQTWPLPYTVDWSTVTRIEDVVDVTDGIWELTPGGIRNTAPGYDRLLVLGDVTWQDYELTMAVTIHDVDETGYEPPSFIPGLGPIFRWTGHTDHFKPGSQPNKGWWPLGGTTQYTYHLGGCGERFELYGNPFVLRADDPCTTQLEFDVTYLWKMRVQTQHDGTFFYGFKVWEQSEDEPEPWFLTMTEPADTPGAGSIALLSHHIDVTFGDIEVVPLN